MSEDRVWYLYTAEGSQGPYAAREIRAWRNTGKITNEWHVWREGMAGWAALGAVPEFGGGAAASPAPVPLKTRTVTCPVCGQESEDDRIWTA